MRSEHGETKAYSLKGDDPETNETIQKEVRRNAKTFLCKRIIICEGKTEIGFIRAFDTYLSESRNIRLAYRGIGTADGGGSTIFRFADLLLKCGYDICLFMDSDLEKEKPDKAALRAKGVSIFDWDEPNAIEEQVFADVPSLVADGIIHVATEAYGVDTVSRQLDTQKIPYVVDNKVIRFLEMPRNVQKSIGTIAKHKNVHWFKLIAPGEAVGNVVFSKWHMIDTKSTLRRIMGNLYRWVMRND